MMSHEQSWPLVANYIDSNLTDRLLATKLLTSAQTAAQIELLRKLCFDEIDPIAAAAWNTLARQHPETLFPILNSGYLHRDANVRFTAVDMMFRFPNEKRCEWLHDAMSDIHIGVRNSARRNLTELCNTHSDLRDNILQRAGDSLNDPNSNWQQLEQALVLLASNRCSDFHLRAIGLLSHDQPEVFVTAAWLLHLMPRQEISSTAADIAIDEHHHQPRETLFNITTCINSTFKRLTYYKCVA